MDGINFTKNPVPVPQELAVAQGVTRPCTAVGASPLKPCIQHQQQISKR